MQLVHERLDASLAFARRCWPGQVPEAITAPEAYENGAFTLEGHELRILEQGRTDTVGTTSLYVAALDLVVAGDVLYNECHMFVGDTTAASRTEWTAALDRLAALNPPRGHRRAQEARCP